jgi:two-component system, cell cycle sensor histidine kinase and response regulator CckA
MLTEDRFFTLTLDLLCIAGLDGYFKRLNPAWEQTLGFPLEELLSRPAVEFIHPDDRARSRELAGPLLSGVDVVRFENRYICKDGSHRLISWACGALQEGDSFIYGVGRDITEQRLAEDELKRKSAELEAVFSALPDLLFRTDADGRLVDYSAGRASDLYTGPDAFLGKTFAEVLPAHVGTALMEASELAHRTDSIVPVEYGLAVPSGEQRFEARVVPFLDRQSITVVRNVTDRWVAEEALKKSEERLRESEKLEAIGRLAGGIAHDFNNLMMAVLTYTDILLRSFGGSEPQRRALLEIRGAGERASGLTRQLLAFAKKQLLSPVVLDPGVAIRDMDGMLRGLIGEHILFTSSCAPGLFSVLADRSQLEQVVLNLALNARDSMPQGGKLTIDASNEEIDEAAARRLDLHRAGHYVRISVQDTGCGITPDARPHLFEPFFTTKGQGRGTGLGLATVYGVVRQSGGSISVVSSPGEGSCFTILLPRADGEPKRVDPPPAREPPRGAETLLVVEDEAAVRKGLAEALRRLGYSVFEAPNAEAALRIARGSDRIHLLLTDVVMPGPSGYELAAWIRSSQPRLRVLYMSGYVPAAAGSPLRSEDEPVLQKPFTLEELARRVREALDGGL